MNENVSLDANVVARQKRLLRVVYIMGIILVLLFLALMGGIVWKAQNKPKQGVSMPAASLDIGVAAADIRATILDGDRMAVTTTKEIVIVDVAKSKVLLRMPLQ
jgi:uncharacterized membrane protein